MTLIRSYARFGEYKKLDGFLSALPFDYAQRFINQKDISDYGTPVHLAVYNNDIRTLCVLRKYGADLNAQTEVSGFTPLMLAIKLGHGKTIDYLLSANVDTTIKNEQGQTAGQMLGRIIQKAQKETSFVKRVISRCKNECKKRERWQQILTEHEQHERN